jgi:hypothetical protein
MLQAVAPMHQRAQRFTTGGAGRRLTGLRDDVSTCATLTSPCGALSNCDGVRRVSVTRSFAFKAQIVGAPIAGQIGCAHRVTCGLRIARDW